MYYTRLCVDPTETLMFQARKKKDTKTSKSATRKMRGDNLFLITIIPKDGKKALNKSYNKHSKRQKI